MTLLFAALPYRRSEPSTPAVLLMLVARALLFFTLNLGLVLVVVLVSRGAMRIRRLLRGERAVEDAVSAENGEGGEFANGSIAIRTGGVECGHVWRRAATRTLRRDTVHAFRPASPGSRSLTSKRSCRLRHLFRRPGTLHLYEALCPADSDKLITEYGTTSRGAKPDSSGHSIHVHACAFKVVT